VELKQGSDLEDPGEGTSFNRTIVELKPTNGTPDAGVLVAFNRTIVELKHKTINWVKLNGTNPLIEPLWN